MESRLWALDNDRPPERRTNGQGVTWHVCSKKKQVTNGHGPFAVPAVKNFGIQVPENQEVRCPRVGCGQRLVGLWQCLVGSAGAVERVAPVWLPARGGPNIPVGEWKGNPQDQVKEVNLFRVLALDRDVAKKSPLLAPVNGVLDNDT